MDIAIRRGRHARPKTSRDPRGLLLVALTAAFEFVVAMLAALSSPFTVVAGLLGLLAIGACVLWPVALMALSFPATFGYVRVGPAAIDMSLTDALAAVSLLAALPYVPWRSAWFRKALLATLGYCAVISTSVVANFSRGAAVEVVHRFVLVMGAVCIGAALARLGHARAALRALMVVAAVTSAAGVVQTLTHGLRPAYPFGMQKNSFGTLVAMSFIVVVLGNTRLELPRRILVPLGALLLAGLAASQSRGAGLALVATFSIYTIRVGWQGRARRLVRMAPVILVVSVAMLAVAIITYQTRDAKLTANQVKYSSVNSRTQSYDTAISDVFLPSPLFGGGPKWFRKPDAPGILPHDIAVSELSEVGLVGTAALVWFLVVMLRSARSPDSDLGEVAWYVLISRILASAVDIFWVAGPTTLPFLVVGLAIGDAERDEPVTLHTGLLAVR